MHPVKISNIKYLLIYMEVYLTALKLLYVFCKGDFFTFISNFIEYHKHLKIEIIDNNSQDEPKVTLRIKQI
jgi:hypothetical protein